MSVTINHIDNRDQLLNFVVAELKTNGIKYRKDPPTKISKKQEKITYGKVFHAALEHLDTVAVDDGVLIPTFVVNACKRILADVKYEGIFRKTGSTKRQKEIISKLERGLPFDDTDNVLDIASILKTFFRSLPEAIIPPGNLQETLIKCLLDEKTATHNILLSCLMLPVLKINTLAYLMQFLNKVSEYASDNKMTIENLAIIMGPNIMPVCHNVQQRNSAHVKIISILIKNAYSIGIVPENILDRMHELNSSRDDVLLQTEKKKKKRRSGSLNRVFNGLRKIVGALGSSSESLERTPDVEKFLQTPILTKSAKKRKVNENPFSARKKKDLMSLLPNNNALLPNTPMIKDQKKTRLSLAPARKENKIGVSTVDIAQSSHPMERRWSFVLSRKKSVDKLHAENKILVPCGLSPVLSMPSLTPDKRRSLMNDDNDHLSTEFLQANDNQVVASRKDDEKFANDFNKMDISDEDFVKIPRSEYEAIKEKVAAIETCISQEFSKNEKLLNDSFVEPVVKPESGPVAVDDKYQATLKETHPINEVASTTDQLAKRLSRELKIRRSTEHQVIRSPSARKIGTMRRRSKENGARLSRSTTWHVSTSSNKEDISAKIDDMTKDSLCLRSNLKRGRPNTYQRHPSPVKKIVDISIENPKDEINSEQWHDAKTFFSDPVNDQHNMSADLIEDNVPLTAKTPVRVLLTPEIQINKPDEANLFKTPQNLPPRMTTAMSTGPKSVEMSSMDKTPMLPPSLPPRRSASKKTPTGTSKTPRMLVPHHTPIQQLQTGRASIARIRANVGHVAAKAKLFDNMGDSNSGEAPKPISRSQVNRRQSIKPALTSQPLLSVPENKRALKENNPPPAIKSSATNKETTTPKRKNLKLSTEAARRYRLQMGVVRSPISANKQRKLEQINAIKLQNRLEEVKRSKHRISDMDDIVQKNLKSIKTENSHTPTRRSSRSGTPKKSKNLIKTPSNLARKSPRTTMGRR
uniref:CSON006928 protein n=1 Tax=Culicoides sonorensis TaxID=179676 RepID=A0A336MT93_CULSO